MVTFWFFFPHGIPALLHIQILLVKDEFSPLEQFSLHSKPEHNIQRNWPWSCNVQNYSKCNHDTCTPWTPCAGKTEPGLNVTFVCSYLVLRRFLTSSIGNCSRAVGVTLSNHICLGIAWLPICTHPISSKHTICQIQIQRSHQFLDWIHCCALLSALRKRKRKNNSK
jgi:hypothetical protein